MKFARWMTGALTAAVLSFGLAGPVAAAAIKILVNNAEITDTQIAERARLIQLERRGASATARQKMAKDELVDEALETQEATRLGITITDSQVSEAYDNVARNLKVSASKLNQLLLGSGVSPTTLKARLKANLAWQAVTRQVVVPMVNVSDLELEKEARKKITAYDNYDYILKEVRFLVTKGSGYTNSGRTAQANRYRRDFKGCSSAVDLSLSYRDVAVIDIGRRHATQLPDAIAKELSNLNIGQLTKPRVGNGSVSMLAVCAKDKAEDTTFVKSELRQQQGNDKLKAAADKYLAQLRKKAAITYK